MRRLAVIVLCGSLVLVGCRPKKASPVPPTTTTLLPATTGPTAAPTTTLDVSAPPTPAQLQDPAYWNAILAALNRVAGDAFRDVVRVRAVEPKAVEALRQIYGPGVFPNQYEALKDIAGGNDGGLLIPPGDPVVSVTNIVKAGSQCAGLTASLDYQNVNPNLPTSPVVVELQPWSSPSRDAVNPTPWKIEELFVIESPDDRNFLCAD